MAQLTLELDRFAGTRRSAAPVAIATIEEIVRVPSTRGNLAERLYVIGLPRNIAVTLSRNRTVLLSWRARTGLRIHAGFAAAPDDVLRAVVCFLSRRASRAERSAARRTFMNFPAQQHAITREAPRRKSRAVPAADQPLVDCLLHLHELLNTRHFAGELESIPIHVSGRMRSRLGELRAPRAGGGAEIAISVRHIRRDGWEAAEDTLLHEMVHQWQVENGHPLDHGREFRRKAEEVGIVPRAVADLR